MSSLVLKQISNIYDALAIVKVRNECRDYMTHNSSFISDDQQYKWYNEIYLPQNLVGHMFAYAGYDDGEVIAFGLMKYEDDKWWLSGGLSGEARGKGYGRELFRSLRDLVVSNLSPEVWLDVLKTNERAVALYEYLGFEHLSDKRHKILIMRWSAK